MDILVEHPLPSILTLAALVLGASRIARNNSSTRPPFPPSPPSQLILGHARLLYRAYGNEEQAFQELGKQYGGIVYLNALGIPMIILNDMKITMDLLEKRGSTFSSRPTLAMIEVMGYTQALAIQPYGLDWRLNRRIFQGYFNSNVRALHRPKQLREARKFLRNVLLAPVRKQGKDWEPEILRFATSIIMATAFGHDVKSDDDPYLKITDDIVRKVMPAMMAADMLSAGLLQVFPLIQYFPSWFPGASAASQARRVRPYVRALYEYPINDMEEKMKTGKAQPSFLATQLEEFKNGEIGPGVTLEHIKGSCASVYSAGTETTASTLLTLLGVLVMHPDVQKKAQAEIDKFVGGDRLPDYSDREGMPYLQCIVEELGRWQPVIPILPRKSTEDEIYEGMFIPKGTTIMVNTRGMSLDEKIYKDPTKFNPDRYLPISEGGNGEPFFELSFGTGRRICPGRWLAQDSIWIVAAHLLATMNVSPVPEEGDVKWKFAGTVNRPLPFKCRIEPRSEQASQLIERMDV